MGEPGGHGTHRIIKVYFGLQPASYICASTDPEINKDKPAYAMIFDNENFHDGDKCTGTEEIESSICSLEENFKGPIVLHEHIIKDLTVDEMKGALKVLGKPNLESLSDQEMREAIKLFYPLKEHTSLLSLDVGTKKAILGNAKLILPNTIIIALWFLSCHMGTKKE